MNKLRVVFMGTPQFSVGIMQAVKSSGIEIVGAVTVADKPAGRGMQLSKSAVKIYCEVEEIPVLQPISLKDENFLAELRNFQADIFVVVAFRMLPKVVWDMPTKGTFNLHASLLPDYRGSAPINWTIINGDQKSGLSTFFIDDKIDTGEVILQVEMKITENENAGSLHDRMMELGGELVVDTLNSIEANVVKTIPQSEIGGSEIRLAPKLFKENTKIDWSANVQTIHNLVRGLSPFPVAWTIWENQKGESKNVKVFETRIHSFEERTNLAHLYSENNQLFFENNFGIIEICSFQIEGKKRIDAASWLVGNEIDAWKIN